MALLVLAVACFATSSEVQNNAMLFENVADAVSISNDLNPTITTVAPDVVQAKSEFAVYSAAEVDIGDSVVVAKPSAISLAAKAIELAPTEIAYSPPINAPPVDVSIDREIAQGFKGLAGNHFARADV